MLAPRKTNKNAPHVHLNNKKKNYFKKNILIFLKKIKIKIKKKNKKEKEKSKEWPPATPSGRGWRATNPSGLRATPGPSRGGPLAIPSLWGGRGHPQWPLGVAGATPKSIFIYFLLR